MKEPTGKERAHVVPAEPMVLSSLVQAVSLKIEADPPLVHPVREKEPPFRGTAGAMQPVLLSERLDPTVERVGYCGFTVLHWGPL